MPISASHKRYGSFASRQSLHWMLASVAMVSLCRRGALAFHLTRSSATPINNSLRSSTKTGSYFLANTPRYTRRFSLPTELSEEQKVELEAKIKQKGDEIRALKDGGADKATVAPLVDELKALKAQLDPSAVLDSKKKDSEKKQSQGNQQQQLGTEEVESDFITSRVVDYSKWYNDIIRVAGLAETSPVRGCMVIKPWGMSIWDRVRNDLDAKIQEHGAENAYFPLLIPKSFLSKEAEHVDGFAKECAIVTHHRLTAF